MEEIQIGAFIRDRRLQLGMTQQQLADKLDVTDKAVSKWERSVSYPDITILRELSDALEVSVSELLAGRREPSPVPPEVEDVVLDTVSYAETARRKNGGWKFWLFIAMSAACLVAVLVLCIVDRFRFRWSQIPIQSIALGWAVCYPLLRVERYPVRRSLTILSIAIVPYLASVFTPVFYIWGIPRTLAVVLLPVAYLWAVYFLCTKYRQQKRLAAGWILILGGLLSAALGGLADGSRFNLFSAIGLLSVGAGLLAGYFWSRAFWNRMQR